MPKFAIRAMQLRDVERNNIIYRIQTSSFDPIYDNVLTINVKN